MINENFIFANLNTIDSLWTQFKPGDMIFILSKIKSYQL
jgi:hypothetical protein